MGLYQSFSQVFVTNSPAILAEGQTVENLAIGQIGFLDAKTHKAVTSPTYAKNKAIKAVWGTPDIDLGMYGGVPNENEYSPLIKGKLIKRVRSKKAQRGQTPLYTIGWSGDAADTDTLSAKVGQSKNLYIKLTGTAIERLYSKQGLIKYFSTTPDCVDDCSDTCGQIRCDKLAYELVDQINKDKDLRKFIRATALVTCDPAIPAPTETNCYKFKLDVCDTGDDLALGLVQAQYPQDKVSRLSRAGAISTYEIIKNVNTLPTAFSNQVVLVPDCPTCPAGSTLVEEGKVFEVKVVCGFEFPAPGEGEEAPVTTLVSSDPQFDVYHLVYPADADVEDTITALEAAGCTVANFIGEKRNLCQFPATTVAWVANGVLYKQPKAYRITLADSVCGTNRLADVQAAYPNNVVTVVNSAGTCVHTYEITVQSNCYDKGCTQDLITFEKPQPFEGAIWAEVEPPVVADQECKCGIQIETAFINRTTNECTFDYFPYENDVVFVQASTVNPDFNADPCEEEWKLKQIRQVQYPQGHGQYIQYLEKESKMYDRRFRYSDPVVRETQGYSLQADPTKFYDQYILEFDYKWKTAGGWSEDYTESWSLVLFVPEGRGAQIEAVLNSYVTSAGIEEDGTAI